MVRPWGRLLLTFPCSPPSSFHPTQDAPHLGPFRCRGADSGRPGLSAARGTVGREKKRWDAQESASQGRFKSWINVQRQTETIASGLYLAQVSRLTSEPQSGIGFLFFEGGGSVGTPTETAVFCDAKHTQSKNLWSVKQSVTERVLLDRSGCSAAILATLRNARGGQTSV